MLQSAVHPWTQKHLIGVFSLLLKAAHSLYLALTARERGEKWRGVEEGPDYNNKQTGPPTHTPFIRLCACGRVGWRMCEHRASSCDRGLLCTFKLCARFYLRVNKTGRQDAGFRRWLSNKTLDLSWREQIVRDAAAAACVFRGRTGYGVAVHKSDLRDSQVVICKIM